MSLGRGATPTCCKLIGNTRRALAAAPLSSSSPPSSSSFPCLWSPLHGVACLMRGQPTGAVTKAIRKGLNGRQSDALWCVCVVALLASFVVAILPACFESMACGFVAADRACRPVCWGEAVRFAMQGERENVFLLRYTVSPNPLPPHPHLSPLRRFMPWVAAAQFHHWNLLAACFGVCQWLVHGYCHGIPSPAGA